MQDAVTPDRELDLLGLRCPLPVLKIARALRGMKAGEVLAVLADDPVSIIDIPAFCQEKGHGLIAEAAPRFVIRKV